MFARDLVESAVLRGRRLELAVRLNWYRALPLSCIERLEVALDGVSLDVTLELDGGGWPVAELGAQDERWWHVRDAARVTAELDGQLDGGPHVVEVLIGSRIPYLVGPRRPGRGHRRPRAGERDPVTPRLGVMLFGLGGLFWQRRLDLGGCLEAVAGLGPDQGIELIGAQSLATYPDVSGEEVAAFRAAVDRTGIVPVSYCAYLERARSAFRVLSPLEAVPLIEQEIAVARRLGFPMVRINTATPEVLRALAPLSERSGTTLVVELATEPRTDPAAAALVEELDRLACPGLGLIQDFSAFVQQIPRPFAEATVAEGTPAEAMAAVTGAWAAGRPVAEAVAEVADLGLAPDEQGLGVQAAHIAYALFRRGDPAGLGDVLPYLRHVQAKFFAVGPDGDEPCVPTRELVGILRDAGYGGRVHSEFEGFLWSDDLDALEQLGRHQRFLTHTWAEDAGA